MQIRSFREIFKVFHRVPTLKRTLDIDAISSKLEAIENENRFIKNIINYEMNKKLGSAIKGEVISSNEYVSDNKKYWNEHNVSQHYVFNSVQESLNFFDFRISQYPGYIELMPVAGRDGEVILDYGCGPGHDLVGFNHFSNPKQLIGVDIAQRSLNEARERLRLHGAEPQLLLTEEGQTDLPLDDGSVDYVHCSGVLMLVTDPVATLREFRRVLKPGGELRLMIYNYNSVWLHLYVAYIVQIEFGLYRDLTLRGAFGKTTDGEDCPLVRVWRPEEMIGIANDAGFDCEFLGAAPSLWEMSIVPRRFDALLNADLPDESRAFLSRVRVDEMGKPWMGDQIAGVDGCFSARPA